MIKLKTLNGEMPFASIDDLKHDALVAHAYQKAVANLWPEEHAQLERKVAELLKKWGVE